MTSTTYKMRAECAYDVGQAIVALADTFKLYAMTMQRCSEFLGDVDVVFSFAGEIAEIKAALAGVEDGHVMYETVARIEDYTGDR